MRPRNTHRVLLFGKDGQVGHALLPLLRAAGEIIAVGRAECDLRDVAAIRQTIAHAAPSLIVNAAAYTAVDRAESDPETCFAVNATAPATMAQEARQRGLPFIHYSTDYVFDGEKPAPYVEEDRTAPLGVYGASKLQGEQEIAESGARFAVLRTSWVYSNHGSNFLKTMLRLGGERPELRVVDDQTGAPTSADAIAAATARIVENAGSLPSGIYHMSAADQTTWYGFATAIFASATPERQPKLIPITTAEYPTPARRPRNSVLANQKFAQAFGFRLSSWKEQLAGVLAARAASTHSAQGDGLSKRPQPI